MSQAYLFFLGSTTDLCYLELEAVTKRLKLPQPTLVDPEIAMVEPAEKLDASSVHNLQYLLGGTVKIAQVLKTTDYLEPDEVQNEVTNLLKQIAPKRFAVSEVGRDHMPAVNLPEIKNELRAEGLTASYLESSRHGVSAAQFKQNMAEVIVLQTKDKLIFAGTLTMQDIDGWTHRDIDKPVRDTKKGMLQPKVARMMVNLAVADNQPSEAVILDPFVGTGTILIEATDLGVSKVLASDYSPDQVIATNKNLEWWKQHENIDFSYEVVRRAVANLQPSDFSTQPTHIVSEPFLGKLRPQPNKIEGIMRGLHKMYKGMIKTFTEVLEPGSKVVIILPSWQIKGKELTMIQTLKHFEKAGFSLVNGPIRAGRVGAITQRYVHVLEYKPYVES